LSAHCGTASVRSINIKNSPCTAFLSLARNDQTLYLSAHNNNLRRTADTVVIDRLMVGGGSRRSRIAKPITRAMVGSTRTRSVRASEWIYYYVCLLPVAGIGSSWPSFRIVQPGSLKNILLLLLLLWWWYSSYNALNFIIYVYIIYTTVILLYIIIIRVILCRDGYCRVLYYF